MTPLLLKFSVYLPAILRMEVLTQTKIIHTEMLSIKKIRAPSFFFKNSCTAHTSKDGSLLAEIKKNLLCGRSLGC